MPSDGTLDRFLGASLLVLADLRDHLVKSFPTVQPEQIDAAIEIGHKYAEWLVGQVRDSHDIVDLRNAETAQSIREALEKFERVRKLRTFKELPFEEAFDLEETPQDPANIQSWDLYEFLRTMKNLDKYLIEPEERVRREKAGSQIVAEDKDWAVIKLSNVEASMKFCKPTAWCTRGPDWAKTYLQDGPLYMVVEQQTGRPKYLMSLDHQVTGTDLIGELQAANREHLPAGELPAGVQELFAELGLLDRAMSIMDPKGDVLNQSFNNTLAAASQAFRDAVVDPHRLESLIVNTLMDATMLEGTLQLHGSGEAATLTPALLEAIFGHLKAADVLKPQYKDLTFQQWAASKGVAAARSTDMPVEEISLYTSAEIRAMALADRFVHASRIVVAFTPEEAKKRFGAGLEKAGLANVDEVIKAVFDLATAAMMDVAGKKLAPPDRYAHWMLGKMSMDPGKVKKEDDKTLMLQQRTEMQALLTDKEQKAAAIDALRRFQMSSGKKIFKKLGLPTEIEKYGSISGVLDSLKKSTPNKIGESDTFEIYFAVHQQDALDNVPADDTKKDKEGRTVEHWCTRYSPDNAANYYPEGPVFFMFEKGKVAGVRDAYAFTVDRVYSREHIGEFQTKLNAPAILDNLPQGVRDALKSAEHNIAETKKQEGPWIGWGGVDLKTYMPDGLVERVSWIGKDLDGVPQMKAVIRRRNMNMLRTLASDLAPMLAEGKAITDIISTVEQKMGERGEWRGFVNLDAVTVAQSIRSPEELFNGLVAAGVLDKNATGKLVAQYITNSKYRKFFKDETDFGALAKKLLTDGDASLEFGGKPPVRVDLDVNAMMAVAKPMLKEDQIIASFRNAIKERVEAWNIAIYMDPKVKWADYTKELYEKGLAGIDWNKHRPGASESSKASSPITLDGDEVFLSAQNSGLITDDTIALGISKVLTHALGGHIKGGPEALTEYVKQLRDDGRAKINIGIGMPPTRFVPISEQILPELKQMDLINVDSMTRAIADSIYKKLGGHVKGGVDGLIELSRKLYDNGTAIIKPTLNMDEQSKIGFTVRSPGMYDLAKNFELVDNDGLAKALAEQLYQKWENLVPNVDALVPLAYKFIANNQVRLDTVEDADTEEETSVIRLNGRQSNTQIGDDEVLQTGMGLGVFSHDRLATATAKMINNMFGGHIVGGTEALGEIAGKIYKSGYIGVRPDDEGKMVAAVISSGLSADNIFDMLKKNNLVDNDSLIEEAAGNLMREFGAFTVDDPKAAVKAAKKLFRDGDVSLIPARGGEPSKVKITAAPDVTFYTAQRAGMIDNDKIVTGVVGSLKEQWGKYLGDDDDRLKNVAQELVDEENAYLAYDEEDGLHIGFGEKKKRGAERPDYDEMEAAREKMGRHRLVDPNKMRGEMQGQIASVVEKVLKEPVSATTLGNIIDESKVDREAAAALIAEYLMDHYKPMDIDESNAHSFLDNEETGAQNYIDKLYQHGDPHYMEQARGYPRKKLHETDAAYAERIKRRLNNNTILQGKISRKNILEAAVMLGIANRSGLQSFSTYYWDWGSKSMKHLPRPPLHLLPLRPGEQDPFAKRKPTEEQPELPFEEPEAQEPPPEPPTEPTPPTPKKPKRKKKAPGTAAPQQPQAPVGGGQLPAVAFRLSSYQVKVLVP